MVVLASINGVKSGSFELFTGVGTVTIINLQSERQSLEDEKKRLALFFKSSDSTSKVESVALFNSSIRAGFISKPLT